MNDIVKTLYFFKTVIDGGEPWTDVCQSRFKEVLEQARNQESRIGELEEGLRLLRKITFFSEDHQKLIEEKDREIEELEAIIYQLERMVGEYE